MTPATERASSILVVDDDEDQRTAMREVLEDAGFTVVGLSNGKAAVDYLTSGNPEPCAVLVDLNMPVMNGWEFIAIMKSYTRLAKIPIVVVSGDEPNRESKAIGVVDHYVRKPFSVEALLSAVQEACVA